MLFKFLFPNKFKKWGWVLILVSIILFFFIEVLDNRFNFLECKVFALYNSDFNTQTFFNFIRTDITATLIGVFFIVGSIIVSFSAEKIEDEFIAQLRLNSFQWAVLVNYVILLLLFIFIYGFGFLSVMIWNMFTVIILFIIRFHYLLYKHKS